VKILFVNYTFTASQDYTCNYTLQTLSDKYTAYAKVKYCKNRKAALTAFNKQAQKRYT